MIDVGANWRAVCARVAAAAARAGRPAAAVRVIAVSKTKPVEMIDAALAAGATDIGENYVQEAAEKMRQVRGTATWHLIGHLQRNKAARAVELFHVIHTLDSVALGAALARHGEQRGRTVRALIEVNLGGEATKTGIVPDATAGLLDGLAAHRWLSIDGLMAIPPPGPSPESSRPYFRRLRELRDALRRNAPPNAPLGELSMGMSGDFEVAVEEGATMVRVGRSIFGARDGGA